MTDLNIPTANNIPKITADQKYVYVDHKPDGTPFYVGIGTLERLKNPVRNEHHSNICAKYDNCYRKVYLIAESSEHAKQVEIDLISQYGRIDLGTGTLCNQTAGGDGVFDWSNELKETVRTKLIHAWKTNEFRSKMTAIRNTEEYKESQRAKAIEQWSDPEAIESLSRILKAKWENDTEFTERMLTALQSDEVREKHKQITTSNWQNPEFREKVLDYIQSDENRERQSKVSIEFWKDPEYRAKQKQTREENGTNEIVGEKQKALWQDPEYRQEQTLNRKTKWQDPDYIQKVMTGCNNPDVIEKRKLIAEYRRKYVVDTSHTGSVSKITKHMINSYYNTDF